MKRQVSKTSVSCKTSSKKRSAESPKQAFSCETSTKSEAKNSAFKQNLSVKREFCLPEDWTGLPQSTTPPKHMFPANLAQSTGPFACQRTFASERPKALQDLFFCTSIAASHRRECKGQLLKILKISCGQRPKTTNKNNKTQTPNPKNIQKIAPDRPDQEIFLISQRFFLRALE